MSMHPSGKHVYVVNRSGDDISHYNIAANGCLVPTAESVTAGKHPLSICIAPAGRFAYVINQNGNSISQYILAENGQLIAMTPATIVSRLTPVSMAVASSGKYAYVANIRSNDVSQYSVGEQGELRDIPANKWGDTAIAADVSPRCVICVGVKPSA